MVAPGKRKNTIQSKEKDWVDLSAEQIMDLLPHRYPFLLVDKIVAFEPEERIVGLKNVTINEPYFEGHFPGHPIMPGVLIIEALAQVGAIFVILQREGQPKSYLYFRKIERAKFKKPVFPGDSLYLELVLKKQRGDIWLLDGKAAVNETIVATAGLEAIVVKHWL